MMPGTGNVGLRGGRGSLDRPIFLYPWDPSPLSLSPLPLYSPSPLSPLHACAGAVQVQERGCGRLPQGPQAQRCG